MISICSRHDLFAMSLDSLCPSLCAPLVVTDQSVCIDLHAACIDVL